MLTFFTKFVTFWSCRLLRPAALCFFTIFTCHRKLRATRQRHILIHFCFSLLFLYTVFIFGVDTAVKSPAGCVTVAALIHYFTLATMMWMGVEARNLYSKLVTVFDAEKDWFMKAASAAAWGKNYFLLHFVFYIMCDKSIAFEGLKLDDPITHIRRKVSPFTMKSRQASVSQTLHHGLCRANIYRRVVWRAELDPASYIMHHSGGFD